MKQRGDSQNFNRPTSRSNRSTPLRPGSPALSCQPNPNLRLRAGVPANQPNPSPNLQPGAPTQNEAESINASIVQIQTELVTARNKIRTLKSQADDVAAERDHLKAQLTSKISITILCFFCD